MKKALLNFLLIFYSVSLIGQIDTEFWFAAPEVSPDLNSFNIPIVFRISTLDRAANVVIDQPANPGFAPIAIDIAANSTQTVDLSSFIDLIENKPANEVLNKGIRILASSNVSIYYEVVSSYCNCNPEIFTLKGKNALGTYFFTPFQNILYNSYTPTAFSAFDIVATDDNTVVIIVPTNDIVGHPAGVAYTIILNKGQTYSARASSQAAGLHLNGSVVHSDKAIAITIKDDLLSGGSYGGCADLAGDQLVPVNRTGKEYVVTKGFLNGPDRVFVLATEDNTQVSIAGNVSGTINAGQTLVYDLFEPSAYIESTGNIYVLQLSGFGCEVGCGLIPPVNCTGSLQIGFTRSVAEDFKLLLMVQSGGEGDFSLNGSPGFITAADFSDVPFSSGKWKAASINLSTSQVPVEQASQILNYSTRFHMGIIHGGATGGCRFGYFSDFAILEPEITANGTDFCEGESLSLTAGELPDLTYEWSGPGGFTTQGSSMGISSLTPENSGYYILNGSNGYCPVIPDSIFVTVHPFPANLGEAIGLPLSLQDSLVAWYPFNGNPDDETGNGNNGTVIGNVVLTTDRYGNAESAYEFPGEAFNYISVPHSSYLEFNTFTISAWIFTETDYGYGQVVQKNRDIIQGHYGLYINWIGANVCYSCNNGAGFQDIPLIGQWHMSTGTISGSDARYYLDGVLIAHDTLDYEYVYSGTDPMAIGMHYYEGVPDYFTYPYIGKIDDVLIYNRVLTAEEVACLYSGDCSTLKLSVSMPESPLCKGGSTSLTLFNAQPGVKYQLLKGGNEYGNFQVGNSDTLIFPIANLPETTSFTILATDTTTGCAITLDSTFVVEVKDVSAIANANMPSAYIPATVEVSSQSVGAATYEWLLDGMPFADTPESPLVIDSTGTHTLVLLVSSGPPDYCTDADTLYLTTTERIEAILEIPASFTPNADGINDYFEFLTEGIDSYSIWLKDPWGVLVYEYDQATGKWDGLNQSGKEASAGPYYYHLSARDYSGQVLERSGVVYLIRDLIELSPNPAKDKLVIKMNGRLPGERSLQLISVHGKVLAETTFSSENFELDITGFNPGLYLLRISNQREILNLKFIKE